MEVWLYAVAMVCIVLALILASFMFVRHYSNKESKSWGTELVASCGITLVLIALLLIPLDVYSVSSSASGDGTHTDSDVIQRIADAMYFLYSAFYMIIILMAFLIMPFAYFYYEEEGDLDDSVMFRACRALKFTLIFMVVFVVLIIMGFMFKTSGASPDGEDWRDRISRDFSDLDQFLSFTLSVLGLFGLSSYILYAAYGMAVLPITLLRDKGTNVEDERRALLLEHDELENQVRVSRNTLDYQTAPGASAPPPEGGMRGGRSPAPDSAAARVAEKYGVKRGLTASEREASRSTRKEIMQAEKKLKMNAAKQARLDSVSRMSRCWTLLSPVRWVFGLLFLGVSLLIVIQMSMAIVDRILHSSCSWQCGFALSEASVANPIDQFLVVLADYFPMDLFFFGSVVVYLYVCCIVGMAALGVRLFFFRMYAFRADDTPVNGLMMGCWLLMFCGLALNFQVSFIAPQYMNFGSQTYESFGDAASSYAPIVVPASQYTHAPVQSSLSEPLLALDALANGRQRVVALAAPETPDFSQDSTIFLTGVGKQKRCSLDHYNTDGTCKLTQIGEFIAKTNNGSPFFGVIQFFANILFVFLFLAFLIYAFMKSNKSKAFAGSDDPDSAHYIPEY